MTRVRCTSTRYLAWGFAFAVCGALFALKTADPTPIDIGSDLTIGMGVGLVVAGAIEFALEIGALYELPRKRHVMILRRMFATIATLALLAIAIWVWLYVARQLFIPAQERRSEGQSVIEIN